MLVAARKSAILRVMERWGKDIRREAQEMELDHEVMMPSMSKRTEAEIKLHMDRDTMEQDRGLEGSAGERVKR